MHQASNKRADLRFLRWIMDPAPSRLISVRYVQPENILDDSVKSIRDTFLQSTKQLSQIRHIWEDSRKFLSYYFANTLVAVMPIDLMLRSGGCHSIDGMTNKLLTIITRMDIQHDS